MKTTEFKNKIQIFAKAHLPTIGVLLLILLAVYLLWFGNYSSMQALPAQLAQVYFDGVYRIGDGEWQEIVKGEHISSTQGVVTLRGNFHLVIPNGEYAGIYRGEMPIAFYTDHINLTFVEDGEDPFVIDMENPLYGSTGCGVGWTAHTFLSDPDREIEIIIRNPHSFGNENAIDEMLSSISFWEGIDFEKNVLLGGETQRNFGMLFMLVSFVFLGIAIFSTLIHVKSSRFIWLLGLVVFFAGLYFIYSSAGVCFWSTSTVSNTTILGCSMMFYMLFLSMSITYFLKSTKKAGIISLIFLAVVNAVLLILPTATDLLFYDTWIWWVMAQIVANIVLLTCLIKECISGETKSRWLNLIACLPILAFTVDIVGTWLGAWQGGIVSKYVFAILFVAAMVIVVIYIPKNVNAAALAKELEMEKIVLNAELAQSRVSTMMSQIRPHFIYNTLGSIEQLCKLDPSKAGELVHNFAKYLRGNFGELDNTKPILLSQEMDHVHYYVNIEKVRFPDMTFIFETNTDNFHIPALTVQPIVENAIKHGLMKLPNGGTIRVVAYETDTSYCVLVEDDGVGFDTNTLLDDREHIGLRNIRERLKVMVGGKLDVESELGVGTKVLITIPKETQ